jgi:predicted ATPase
VIQEHLLPVVMHVPHERPPFLYQLTEALEILKDKKGSIISICGPAGTGKSRLVEEFKASLNLEEIQWLEGYAYPYSQNISYSPLIDLLNNGFQIKEGDPPEVIREKVESGIFDLVGAQRDVVPYIGSLFSLSYPEIDVVSPDFWKGQL